MPIISYLVHPHEGKKEELINALEGIDACEVYPAQNRELLVLVTETESKAEEDMLKQKLETIDSLKMLSMVSGYNTGKI